MTKHRPVILTDHIERAILSIRGQRVMLDADLALIYGTAAHARHFTGPHQHRVVPGAGHNLPQEKPRAFANAILELTAPSKT